MFKNFNKKINGAGVKQPTEKQGIGSYGEELASEFLVSRRYQILERNYSKPWGEIDLITKAPDRTTVFVEVKTMKENPSLLPEENLTKAKLKKLQKTASLYANSHPELIDETRGWRIDLIAITINPNQVLTNGQDNTLTNHYKDCLIKHFENI